MPNVQPPALPPGPVPATFRDWQKAHFHNPNQEPIEYVPVFIMRKPAPNLRLKRLNSRAMSASFAELKRSQKWG